ncbi:cysteine desulfurase family protein [Moorella sp. Hama-1]|uniref:cysteine desulfurase family protein n=1 Tax=Moorella sp. Hama-1 TaxID=2138101 RepID=UPI0019148B25|nr:cysteine desulfurase family protein [Moorella sp. Hama-1]
MSIYLDYQSAKPVDPRVLAAMLPYFHEQFGNPSSLHAEGDAATAALEEARETVAAWINATSDEIIFTSGATEANNLALIGYALRNQDKGKHIIISEIEHISIHNIAKYLEQSGFKISRVPVDQYGRVSLSKLKSRITPETILISVGYASNEIGTVQPIAAIGALARSQNIVFHCDGVAAEGLLSLDVQRDQIDLLTLSANDIYGPKGVGALYVRRGLRLKPLLIGGGQERGLRSGSENIPGIVGMARAAAIMSQEMALEVPRLRGYRDKLITGVLATIPRSFLNGHPQERLANNAHFRFQGVEGESLLLSLKQQGVAAMTGSACTARTLEPSHTLISIGLLHEEAHGSLEFTCGRFTRAEDIDRVLEILPGIVERLRKLSPLYQGNKG